MKRLLSLLFLLPFLAHSATMIVGEMRVTNTLGVGGVSTFTNLVNLTNIPGQPDGRLRIYQTNGRGYTEFTVTNSVMSTNRFVFSIGSNTVTAGQALGVHSTSISDGINTIVVTNGGSVSALSGSTNFFNLSVQAAKLPTTNYPFIDAGWQAWETVYSETNAEGSRVNLNASWQFMVPTDYATNSLKLLINYSLLNTNGPNTSNVVWGASILSIRSGTTNNVHTNLFGNVVKGSNDWIAKYDGTNIVTNLVINLDTSSLLMARDLSVIKLERFPTEDTFGGAVSVHGLQLEYTRP